MLYANIWSKHGCRHSYLDTVALKGLKKTEPLVFRAELYRVRFNIFFCELFSAITLSPAVVLNPFITSTSSPVISEPILFVCWFSSRNVEVVFWSFHTLSLFLTSVIISFSSFFKIAICCLQLLHGDFITFWCRLQVSYFACIVSIFSHFLVLQHSLAILHSLCKYDLLLFEILFN